jgi:integrase
MRIPSYIQRSRHGIFFFRIVVPRALRESCDGRWEIKGSLHTRNQREALRMARPLTQLAFSLFDRMAAGMSTKMPTLAEIEAKARAGELRDLRSSQTITLPNGEQHGYTIQTDSNDPAELAAFAQLEKEKQVTLDKIARGYRERNIDVPDTMRDYQQAQRDELQRHNVELAASRSAIVSSPKPNTAQADAGPKFSPENTVSKLWLEHYAQMDGGEWSAPRTSKANQRMFDNFMYWWKTDGDVSLINRELINRYIKFLLTEKVVEAGANSGKKGLTPTTAGNFIGVLNNFLTWCQGKGPFPADRLLPTANQGLVTKKTKKRNAAKANPIHTIGQLQKLFDPKEFQPNEAHHFWPPLIALFTGARRREVAQLLLSDFFVKDGIYAMSINVLEDEDKSVKSAAAIRVIPVHPELIELGLPDYIKDVHALGLGPEVFPGIGVNVNGEKGNAIGNFWRGHMKKLGLFNARSPTFHSFRSTALQELKDRGVEWEMRCQLAGHEIDHVSEGYNPNKFSLKRLMEDGIPKLQYEGLDLTGLKYHEKRFDRANKISSKARIKREKSILRKSQLLEQNKKNTGQEPRERS